MKMSEVVKKLDLGNSVAEFDESLEKYFVETEPFRQLVTGKIDIVAGDKGTGKTAIFRVLRTRYASLPEMKGIEVIPGFNPSGNPVFQRLAQEKVLTEAQYRSLWKAYVLSLVGNWFLQIVGDERTDAAKKLDELLNATGLRSLDDAPATVFSKLLNSVKRIFNPKSAEMKMTMSETGIPIVVPKVEFGAGGSVPEAVQVVPHEDALALLDKCLAEFGVVAWIALDRLDEAFQGFPEVETNALRALLRTYLDLLAFPHMRLKLFVRRDLFRKVIGGGFVNLTHVNARKVEIVWEEEDLLNLLCRRIRENGEFVRTIKAVEVPNDQLFYEVFPPQIDRGERKANTWSWIMSRIRDGNNIKPPRNLIDLTIKAREAQLRREDREPREYEPEKGIEVIEGDSIKRGLERLSVDRVEDTLLAEAGDAAQFINSFRRQKSEYNLDALRTLLGTGGSPDETESVVRQLIDIGFLEKVGDNFKIPLLYRDGLEISQGKAF